MEHAKRRLSILAAAVLALAFALAVGVMPAWADNVASVTTAGGETSYYTTLKGALDVVNGNADNLTTDEKYSGATISILVEGYAAKEVESINHYAVTRSFTLNANGADFGGGEFFSLGFHLSGSRTVDGALTQEETTTLNINNAKNLYVWGACSAQEDGKGKVWNINLSNCTNTTQDMSGMVGLYGGSNGVIVNTSMKNCSLSGSKYGIDYVNGGTVELDGCTFSNCKSPVKLGYEGTNTKLGIGEDAADGGRQITIKNCVFNGCGSTSMTGGDYAEYAAPIGLKDKGKGGKMTVSIENVTFTGTVGNNGDILVGDGRSGKNVVGFDLTLDNETDVVVKAEQAGYYGGTGVVVDETKAQTYTKKDMTITTECGTVLPVKSAYASYAKNAVVPGDTENVYLTVGCNVFGTIASAVDAWNNATTAGNYTITVAAGTYNEADMVISQREGYHLAVQPAEGAAVTIAPEATQYGKVFLIDGQSHSTTQSSFTLEGITFDMSQTTIGNSNAGEIRAAVWFLAGGSGTPDPILGGDRRYGHNVTIKSCVFYGQKDQTYAEEFEKYMLACNGTNSGAGNLLVDGCTIKDAGYVISGYIGTAGYDSVFGLKISNTTVANCKALVNNQIAGAVAVEGCTVQTMHDYVIRTNGGAAVTVKDTTIDASQSTQNSGGIVVVRSAAADVAVENCVFTMPTDKTGWHHVLNTSAITLKSGSYLVAEKGATKRIGELKVDTSLAANANYDFVINYVAQIGETKYETLQDAVDAVESGASEATTIKMIDDATTDTVKIPSGKIITLDLNGKTISGEVTQVEATDEFAYVIENSGILTITDNSSDNKAEAQGKVFNNTKNVTKPVQNYKGTDYVRTDRYGSVWNTSSGTITIEAGWFGCESPTGGSALLNNGTATVTEGHFTIGAGDRSTRYSTAYTINNTCGTLTVNGGTLYGNQRGHFGTTGDGENAGSAVTTVNNVTIEGQKYYYNFYADYGATVVVDGGTYRNGGWSKNCASYAFCIDNYDDVGTSITVNGGTFTHGNYAQYGKTFDWCYYDPSDGYVGANVKGGTWDLDPSNCNGHNYVAEGYVSVSNGDSPETWTVKPAEASITDAEGATTYYATLQEAIDAVQAGQTIELLRDIELGGTEVVTMNNEIAYAIDGKGHKITPASDHAYTYHRFQLGENSAAYSAAKNYTIKNLTISGFTDSTYFVRVEGVSATFENCVFANNDLSATACGDSRTVLFSSSNVVFNGCTFEGNKAKAAIVDFCTNAGDETDSFKMDNCLFKQNTATGTGIVWINVCKDDSGITNTTFEQNTVNASSAASVVYLSDKCAVKTSLFKNNAVVSSAESGVKVGVVCMGSGAADSAVTANAFDGNAVTSGTTQPRGTVYVGATGVDLSGNFWGSGKKATEGDGKDVYVADGKSYTADGFAVSYNANTENHGVTVKLATQVARVDGIGYYTIEDAIAAAAGGKTVTMIANAAEDIVVPADLSCTLDLNGYAVTGAVRCQGTLALKDSSAGNGGSVSGALTVEGAGKLSITGGCYGTVPDAYVASGYKVVASEVAAHPFAVVEGTVVPGEPETVVTEDTKKAVDLPKDTPEETVQAVKTAVEKSSSEGVSEALADRDAIVQRAIGMQGAVTEAKVDAAALVTVDIAVNVTAEAAATPSLAVGSLAYDVTPTATVTTRVAGAATAVQENVKVMNDDLNGETFLVTVGCAGIKPAQVVHTCSDGVVEVFSPGEAASRDAMTFDYDEKAQTVTVQITRFSLLEVLGTAAYANVTFDANGGEGSMAAQGVKVGVATALPACAFSRTGYAFAGWNTKADGTGTAYKDGAEVTLTADTVLYAQWTVSARIAGDDRYGTAAKAALEAFPAGANAVVVASGENFPDALCASALAGLLECPVVLTPQASLSADAASAIEALAAGGSVDAYVVGGTAAVSADAVAALKAVPGVAGALRIAGEDRYGTAEAIYAFGADELGGWGSQAVLATGANYPDALSMSAFAYALDAPILLTDAAGAMTKGTADILANGRIDNVVIAGGTAAVSPDVDAEAKRLTGGTAVRLAGEDRYGTSKAVAEYLKGLDGFSLDGACVATGKNFADALAAGPLAGANRTAVLLADDGFEGALDALKGAGTSHIYVMGGTAAVPASVEAAALEAAGLR